MDKSILVASDTKSRASTRITRVSRRLQSREKQSNVQPVASTKRVRERRSTSVIHVSIYGPKKYHITRNNQVSVSNNNQHSSFYNTANNINYLESREPNSQLTDRTNQKNSNDQILADSFAFSNIYSNLIKNSWLNRTNSVKNERGQILSDRQRKQKKRRTLPVFSRLCFIWCLFCCLLAAILIGTLIATLVLLFISSTSTTTLSTNQTTINLSTITSLTTTTETTTTVTDSMTVTTTMDNTTQTTTTTVSDTTTTTISTTAGATICSTTAITTTITTTPLPPQCSNYTSDTSATRNAAYTVLGNACDTFSPSPKWFRFSGGAGTMVANCPVHFSNCNTNMAGWYSGVYPSIAGDTTSGT
ncbi:unnamed protein product, partial [Rotaria sordida]